MASKTFIIRKLHGGLKPTIMLYGKIREEPATILMSKCGHLLSGSKTQIRPFTPLEPRPSSGHWFSFRGRLSGKMQNDHAS
jgi:hypothetical protein